MDDLLTDRLVLRPMDPIAAVRVMVGEPAATDHWAPGYPGEGDVCGAENVLGHCARNADPRPWTTYEVLLRATDETIGTAGFHGPPDEHATVAVGYGLVPTAWGHGYATEALKALLTFAREQGIYAVQADTNQSNVASQHVLTKAGLRLIAEDDELKYYEIVWPEGGS